MGLALIKGDDLARRRQAAVEKGRQSGRGSRRHQSGTDRQGLVGALRREQLDTAPLSYYAIMVVVAVLVLLGLVMLLSASAAKNVGGDSSPYSMVLRQVMWTALGILGMAVAMRVPYRSIRPLAVPAAIIGFGLMGLPFVDGVGKEVNDARSWVNLGPISFQPSEILKILVIVLVADMVARRERSVGDWRVMAVPVAGLGGLASAACMAQGDVGSAVVLMAVVMTMLLFSGAPLRHIGAIAGASGFVLLLVIVATPRRFNRFIAFLDVEGNKDYLAYQSWQGLLSIANGGLTGSGIGGSRSKLGYLPLAHSDFIFAIVADELGIVGSIAVIGGFGMLVWFGIQAALAAPDRFGQMLAAGIASWFGLQTLVNVGGVVAIMPVTGITLPFFSYGGSSMSTSLVAAGLLLNVARRGVSDRSMAPATGRRRSTKAR
ncbi:MAG: cell division protein FtsW [Actinobacteria bacterium]|jgi:cell division protein FtsW|nr:cell division protein FtsW [Actinomycetota bacterium]